MTDRERDVILKFEVYRDQEFWCARGIGVEIFTQARSLDELTANIKEAIATHLEGEIPSGEPVRVISISEFEVGGVGEASSG